MLVKKRKEGKACGRKLPGSVQVTLKALNCISYMQMISVNMGRLGI